MFCRDKLNQTVQVSRILRTAQELTMSNRLGDEAE